MKKLKKQLVEMQLKYNGLELKCTNEARQLQHNIEMTIKAINVIQCCKSDSEQLVCDCAIPFLEIEDPNKICHKCLKINEHTN